MTDLDRTTPGLLRLEPWPDDPSVGHLVVLDQTHGPDARSLDGFVDEARRAGYTTLRTSALFPTARRAVERYGFETVDELALLRADLDEHAVPAARLRPDVRVRRLPRRLDDDAATVDRASFATGRGNDLRSIRAIRRATPRHRARCIRVDGRVVAFAIAGIGGSTGYVQRLAVHPAARRHGYADAMVRDLFAWFRRSAVDHVLVNTGTDNTAALELYRRHGFRRLDQVLVVAELRLDRVAPGSRR